PYLAASTSVSATSLNLHTLARIPYTTLFRSHQVLDADPLGLAEVHGRAVHRREAGGDLNRADRVGGCHRPHRDHHRSMERPSRRDRKSTRLNSSHQIISYAVLCLKKTTMMSL